MSEFEDKTVVVTGGAGVLGRAVADRFHGAGANVAVIDIEKVGAPYKTVVADLIDPSGARGAIEEIDGELGPIDVLANIAGGFTMGTTVAETTDDTFEFMWGLNAKTMINTTRAVVPSMVERGSGKIINIGARAGLKGAASMGAYCASKSVVMRLTESLSEEFREHGINVNCILPSIIDTPRNREDMPKADFSRWVQPEQIAQIIMFLASAGAAPIHGALIPVDGLS